MVCSPKHSLSSAGRMASLRSCLLANTNTAAPANCSCPNKLNNSFCNTATGQYKCNFSELYDALQRERKHFVLSLGLACKNEETKPNSPCFAYLPEVTSSNYLQQCMLFTFAMPCLHDYTFAMPTRALSVLSTTMMTASVAL